MSFFLAEKATPTDIRQSRLMQLAALFMLAYSIILTLSPAARLQSWNVAYRWNHWIGFVVWLLGTTLVNQQIMRRHADRDPFLFPIASLLAGWGLLEIWRLDASMGARQTIWLAVSLLVVWIGLRVPDLTGWLRRYKYIWLISGLVITGLTFVLGTYPGGVGPHLWLGCCGIYFQPSEPLKLLLIIYLAAYLADRLPLSFDLAALLVPTLILAGAALGLLLAQRDLGTASIFILLYTITIYLASGRRRILVISGVVLVAAAILGYLLFDVVRLRVDSWINPWSDPAGRSFQIVQSLLAVANGELLGRGPGLGSPSVVPVAHSDFIFAAIAEETGVFGSIGMLVLFALIIQRGFHLALCAPTNYRRYLAAGLSVYLGLQTILITGGNLRLLPLTGVTLPFVSYGGSSLLTAFITVLLLILISDRDEEEPAPLPNPRPYLLVSTCLLVALIALALVSGWWAGVRSDDLLSRNDNPRWSLNDRYVKRGALLDRNNTLIDHTEGQPGTYQRVYDYSPLATTTGYLSSQFGLAGLESSFDPYLRGLRGNPASLIWWDRLLNGQTPPGLNVRLTIDLSLQRRADDLLKGHTGSLVLLNSQTGEILAMASHPTFDPAQIDENWSNLIQDKSAPLLNRATQGQYPPGTALGPFLLAQTGTPNIMADASLVSAFSKDGKQYACALAPASTSSTWGDLISRGCPAASVALSKNLSANAFDTLLSSLGFYQNPDIPLLQANASRKPIQQLELAAIGQENLTVTPLQMALAAAALNNNGTSPAPQIAGSVETPTQGWLVLPAGNSKETLLVGKTSSVIDVLRHGNDLYWQSLGSAYSAQTHLTWLLAGTLPNHPGTPLTLVIVLEEDNASLAQQVAQNLLNNP